MGVRMAECDFCGSPDVQWAYPARDFVMLTAPEIPKDWGSKGAWAACPACHALIQRGLRDKLATRCAKRMARRHGTSVRSVLSDVRRLQDAFWSSREGAPTPIGAR